MKRRQTNHVYLVKKSHNILMEPVLMMISCQILLDFYCCPLKPNNCIKCQTHSHRRGPFTQTPSVYISVLHCSQLRCLRTSSVLIFHLSFRNIDNIDCLHVLLWHHLCHFYNFFLYIWKKLVVLIYLIQMPCTENLIKKIKL